MRATLFLLVCVATASGCDGLLGINQHVLAEAGAHGEGGLESDGESEVTVSPGPDGGGRVDADSSAAGDQ